MDASKTSARQTLLPLMVVAVVGFGFLQGARLLDPASGPYSHYAFALLGLAIDGITFLAVAILSYFAVIERPEPLFVVGFVAAFVHIILDVAELGSQAAYVLMQIAAGVGWSLNVLCWMAVFVSYRPRTALPMIALGYVVDVAIQPLKSFFPQQSIVVFALVYAASIVLLFICLRRNVQVAISSQDMEESPQTTLAEAYSRTRRAIAATFAFSIVCGFVLESDYLNTGLEYAQTSLTATICLGCAIVMTLLLLVFRVRKADIDYVCPLAAACIASTVLFRGLGIGGDYVAGCIMTATLVSFYVFLWLMFISEARERMLPVFFLLGLALATARLSVATGRLVSEFVHMFFPIDSVTVSMLALWMLATVVSLVFFFSLRSRKKYALQQRTTPSDKDNVLSSCAFENMPKEGVADKHISPKEYPDENPRSLESTHATHTSKDAPSEFLEAFDLLVSTYKLSARESEVLQEFAIGRSARYIAEWHMLSEHTVKTHIRRAYAKMDVHSRQELLDRIDEMTSYALKDH